MYSNRDNQFIMFFKENCINRAAMEVKVIENSIIAAL